MQRARLDEEPKSKEREKLNIFCFSSVVDNKIKLVDVLSAD